MKLYERFILQNNKWERCEENMVGHKEDKTDHVLIEIVETK